MMKRIRVLIVLGAVAAALGLLPAVGKAAGTSGGTTTNSVTIQPTADYDFVGTNLDVGLYVRCTGGSGAVDVFVEQFPPETPYPIGDGSGPQLVVCDGKTREVGVTIVGFGFDAGKAKATATLVAPSGTKQAVRWINIRVV